VEVGVERPVEPLVVVPSGEEHPFPRSDQAKGHGIVEDREVLPGKLLAVTDDAEHHEAGKVTVVTEGLCDQERGPGRGELAFTVHPADPGVDLQFAFEPGDVVIDHHDLRREVSDP